MQNFSGSQNDAFYLGENVHTHKEIKQVTRTARDARQQHMFIADRHAHQCFISTFITNFTDAHGEDIADTGALRRGRGNAHITRQHTDAHMAAG